MNIIFTIATNSHLGHAKSLLESFHKYNDNYVSIICLIDNYDNVPENLRIDDSISICNYKDLRSDEVESMAKRYTPFEFSCAMKPFFAEYLLEKYIPSSLVYLDSDIIVFNNLKLDLVFENFSILLTPHCTMPYEHMELNQLNYGLYNAGFFGVKNNSNALLFIKWWKKNLLNNCIIDLVNGKYVDQIWLNLVPIYFDEVHILLNTGYNLARWNLKQRKIDKCHNKYIVNEVNDLLFFHYSGYNFIENDFPIDNPYIEEEVNSIVFQCLLKEVNCILSANKVQQYKLLKANYGYIEPIILTNRKNKFEIVSKLSTKIAVLVKKLT